MRSIPDEPLRALVLWEPVLATDLAPPTSGALARIRDRRVAHFWDGDRAVSDAIIRLVRARPELLRPGDEVPPIVWDVVMVFPAGVRWEESFPEPSWYGAPVMDGAVELGAQLEAARASAADAPSRLQ